MFNAIGLSAIQITSMVQSALSRRRAAQHAIDDIYAWSSGVSSAELVAVGFTSGDANALLSAIADAHAEGVIHNVGQAPSGYPQVAGTPYAYAASQNQILGPMVGQ